MNKSFLPQILIIFLIFSEARSQPVFDTVALIAVEEVNTQFCFNNTKLMAGKSMSDRYLVYYNPDTIFLNILQNGTWIRKIAHTGSNIRSATLTTSYDRIWICWKEGPFIKASYTTDKGNTWSDDFSVSPPGNVSAPSIHASSNGKVHFVWHTESPSDTSIFYRAFNHDMFTTSPQRLSNQEGHGLWPSVISIGDTVLCTWKEAPLPTKVWFRNSFDGGNTWNPLPPEPTTTALTLTKDPNLAYAFDSTTKTHYTYLAYDGHNKIYLQRSTDFGASWSPPDFISNPGKLSQFAHIDCNNKGFIGISYEQRPIGTSLFNDKNKDVGFTFSSNWGSPGSFSTDTLAYTYNNNGSVYAAFNKIDDNSFFLTWLSKDTIENKTFVFERRIHFNHTTDILSTDSQLPTIDIYPNPFMSRAFIKSDVPLSNASIYVFNASGQLSLQLKNINGKSIEIDRSNLASGVYLVATVQNNRIIATKKIIVAD